MICGARSDDAANCGWLAYRRLRIVDLSVSEEKLVAAPVRKKKLTLKQLLAKVNENNLHAEVDSGPSVGREVW